MYKLLILMLVFVSFGAKTFSQRILLSQGFENGPYTGDSLPLKWAKVKVNGPDYCNGAPAADWRVRDSGKTFCATVPLPGYMTKSYHSRKSLNIPWTATGGGIVNDWVFTDSLRIATNDTLMFWVQLGTWPDGQSSYYFDSLQVWVTSAQTPASQVAKLGTITSLSPTVNTWQFKTYNLSAYNGQRIYIAFRYYMNISGNGLMVNIDSVMVRNMNGSPISVHNNNSEIPNGFNLKQNYPNPFNPTTTISFELPEDEFVNLTVYNALGEEAAVLVNENTKAGSYDIKFDASNLPSGVYLYRLSAGLFTKSVKMCLIK